MINSFVWLFFFLFFGGSGQEKSLLLGGKCSICCHMALVLACMHLCSIFNLRLLFKLSILFYNVFNLVFKRQTEKVNGTSITFFAIFLREQYTAGANFWIMFVCFTLVKCACFEYFVCKMCMFCIVFVNVIFLS